MRINVEIWLRWVLGDIKIEKWLNNIIELFDFFFFNNENMSRQTNNYMRAWVNSYHIEKTTKKCWLIAIVVALETVSINQTLVWMIQQPYCAYYVFLFDFAFCCVTWKCWLVLLFIIDWVDWVNWFDWNMIDLIDKIEIIQNLVCKNIDPNGRASLNTRH